MDQALFISQKEVTKAELQKGFFRSKNLEKLGLDLNNWDHVIALAGNPNTGKSTVFNSLTGLRQHTGNWPGKTVSRAEGAFRYSNKEYKLVDLPGTYSLLSASEDEEIARNFILFGQPDVTVIVVDATRLERNLALTLQILEITGKVVVCLNLMDEAERKGININVKELSKELGVPVVATSARYNDGLDKLLSVIKEIAEQDIQTPKPVTSANSEQVEKAIDELEKDLVKLYPNLVNTRWIARRLLDGDERISEALIDGELEQLTKEYHQQPLDLKKELEIINKEDR